MSKAANENILQQLHALVADTLIREIGTEPTPQMLAQAIKFLKDNGIEPARDADHSALNALADKIGTLSDEELGKFIN